MIGSTLPPTPDIPPARSRGIGLALIIVGIVALVGCMGVGAWLAIGYMVVSATGTGPRPDYTLLYAGIALSIGLIVAGARLLRRAPR
jgi:hypothetical protein